MSKEKQALTQEQLMELLNACYEKVLNGMTRLSPPINTFAQNYLDKHPQPSDAAKAMQQTQIVKCTTSGFLTGFGGIITLPVAIPANIGSVLYVQMRMIACTAYLAGYDVDSDQVQTLVYACLAGVAVNEIIKKAGIELGQKLAVNLIKKVPGTTLTKINQKVGFRFITKFGQKGLINMGKLVPVVGAAISGGMDLLETKVIAQRAYQWFFEGDFSVNTSPFSQKQFAADAPIDADIVDETV